MGLFSKKDKVSSRHSSSAKKWELPSLDLLDDAPNDNKSDKKDTDLEKLVTRIVTTYGCSAKLEHYVSNPRIHSFKYMPTHGEKVKDIDKLHRALAQELDTDRIRLVVEKELNGRFYVELPKENTETVWLKQALSSKEYKNSTAPLSIPIGKGLDGKFEIADLHAISPMIAAGQTGSGKSNFTETALILSLLYRNTPEDLKLILIDPKMVQFSQYSGIPHLLQPPITSPEDSKKAFEWLLKDMNDRLKTLSNYHLKNTENFTASPMSNIVVIIDEVADLMMVDPEFYSFVFKTMALRARTAGIHLYMASSRPGDDVFPDDIIVGFLHRIAFTTASSVDSEKIIHTAGAENLLSKGDLLYRDLTETYPLRLQAPFTSEEAMDRVADFWRNQK